MPKDKQHSINSILIANRGEIASRIIRTCKKMGIKSIAVFSEADRNAPYVSEADQAIFIGESNPAKSYLDHLVILEAATQSQADAIHPGYGFLSENAAFAEHCAKKGIVFIGPNPNAIAAMGSKSAAKQLMQENGVPVVPGYQGVEQSNDFLQEKAIEVGFPLLLKATAGGGGKGMRIVREKNELAAAIKAAKSESLSAFGDDELIIEKYIERGRHIEFQIFGDQHGNAIHILERECSIQRRYQKVIEESPSPVMSDKLREEMGAAAVNAAKALHYDNAGTVEFIYDDKTGEYFFLEVNTRLQVEHPVTEEITGLDLVQMQIESAQGQALRVKQEDIKASGYALEVRLYAEDPTNDFLPVTGTVGRFEFPEVEGLRIESAVRSGSEVSVFYDPMIAKIIVHDQSRQSAHRKMRYVLDHMLCQGLITNLPFLKKILAQPEFQAGKYDTNFIAEHITLRAESLTSSKQQHKAAIAACLYFWKKREQKRTILNSLPSGWRNNFYQSQSKTYQLGEAEIILNYRKINSYDNKYSETTRFDCQLEGNSYQVTLTSVKDSNISLEIDGILEHFTIYQKQSESSKIDVHSLSSGNISLKEMQRFPEREKEKEKGGYETPMPSQIVKIMVKAGEAVATGDPLIVLSSMKMENTILASEPGIVEEVYVEEGANVPAGFLLLKLKSSVKKSTEQSV